MTTPSPSGLGINADEDVDGDWLGDGQQIDDPGPVNTNAPMHGVNPLGSASFDVPINLNY